MRPVAKGPADAGPSFFFGAPVLRARAGASKLALMLRAMLVGALAALALPVSARAAVLPGDFDLGFSGDGFLSGSISAEQEDFGAAAVHVLPDGRILVANTTDVLSGPMTNLDFQPDGKILLAGRASPTTGTGGDEFAVVRLEPDGDLDPAFDGENADSGDGIVRFEVGSGNSVDRVFALTLQPDGRIVLAGSASVDPSVMGTSFDFAAVRLLESGSFDDSFSGDGMDIQTLGAGTVIDGALAVTLAPGPTPQAPDIVVAGQRNPGIDGADFGVIRWRANGTLDTTFNGTGKLVLPVSPGGGDIAEAVVASGDRLLLAGTSDRDPGSGYDGDVAVVALSAGGDLDPGFGTGGKFFAGLSPEDSAAALRLDPAGRLLVAGGVEPGTEDDAALLRITPAGQLDTSFSGDGCVRIGSGDPASNENGAAVAVGPDGKLVAAGDHTLSGANGYFVARLHGNGIPDPAPPGGAADGVAPVLSGLSLRPPRFRVARDAAPRSAGRKRRAHRGTRIRLTLSEPAALRLTITRAAHGRRVAGRCRKPTRRNRGRKRCTLRLTVGTLARSARPAGRQALVWSGRIVRRALRPRRYRLAVRATDAAGNRSRVRAAAFTIVR
jgi:uncharacterized delta-60 repeat protein